MGYSFLVKDPQESIFASYLIRFRPKINEKYVAYYLQSPAYWQAISEKSLGIAIPNVNASKLKEIPIPLPPLAEQELIVAKIEELFTQLEAGTAALARVRAGLKRYKASVLKAACEGRLVPQDPSDEPAEVMLRRMGMSQNGDLPIKPLPHGWFWAKIGDIAETIGGITKGRVFAGKKTIQLPYLRVANVQRGYLDLQEMKEIELLVSEIDKYALKNGDIVLTEGGDWDKLGRSAVWNSQIDGCVHQNHIFRARLRSPEIVPEWLMYYTNSEQGQNYFKESAKQTTNLASINLTQLRACPIPIPPKNEMAKIVVALQQCHSDAEQMELIVENSLKRSIKLRQSILKRAFEGRLA